MEHFFASQQLVPRSARACVSRSICASVANGPCGTGQRRNVSHLEERIVEPVAKRFVCARHEGQAHRDGQHAKAASEASHASASS